MWNILVINLFADDMVPLVRHTFIAICLQASDFKRYQFYLIYASANRFIIVQLMACRLLAPSHYLNKFQLNHKEHIQCNLKPNAVNFIQQIAFEYRWFNVKGT